MPSSSMTYPSQIDEHVCAWKYGEPGQHDAHLTEMRRHWEGVFIYVSQHDAHIVEQAALVLLERRTKSKA